jgi:hypothetical protein
MIVSSPDGIPFTVSELAFNDVCSITVLIWYYSANPFSIGRTASG